jgi:ABC-type Fe3+-siderophore transport system permease subunit
MADVPANLNFSGQYILSILIVLIVVYFLMKNAPQLNIAVVLITGLVIGYIAIFLVNTFFPSFNSSSSRIYDYFMYYSLNNYNNTGYIQIWPPLLAVLIIFIILLYNRQLG